MHKDGKLVNKPLTRSQLEHMIYSQKQLRGFIDLAAKMRKRPDTKDVDFFKSFFMKVEEFL